MLACVNILIRFVSVAFNAYVSAKVGAEGMGLITLVMSVYGMSVTLASSGVNLAAVRLTAETLSQLERENAVGGAARLRAVVRGCVLYSLLFGLFAAVSLFALSGAIGEHLLGDVRTVASLRALALSLPAISLSSALAGYFTGVRRVYKNAVVSVLEQFARITLSCAALFLLAPAGVEYACLAVVGGSALAEGASLVSSLVLYVWEVRGWRPKGTRGSNDGKAARSSVWADTGALRRVFTAAFPVAVGAYARQGLLTAEHLAIPWGLRRYGGSAGDALASFGVVHGMVYPLIFFPASVIGAFSSLLVPEFAQCRERGEEERIRAIAARVIRTSLLFSVGVAGIFLSFAYDIGTGVYPGTDAAAHLAVLAPLIPVMYLDSSVDSMLKGLGEQVYCMKVNIADSLVCLVLVVLLLPRFGLRGYFFVQYACELMNASLSIGRLLAVTGLRVEVLRWVFKPTLSVILAASAVHFLSGYAAVPLIGAGGIPAARVAAAVLLYLLFAALTGAFGREDVRWASSVVRR
ncbi:MAG: oligosaccharide flippase family protein [Eubacteriales bacterium]